MEAEHHKLFTRVRNEKVAELCASRGIEHIPSDHLLFVCEDHFGSDIREATLEEYRECQANYEWECPDPYSDYMEDFAWLAACTEELVKRGELPKLKGLLDE